MRLIKTKKHIYIRRLLIRKQPITGITRNEVKKFHSEFIEEIEKVINVSRNNRGESP